MRPLDLKRIDAIPACKCPTANKDCDINNTNSQIDVFRYLGDFNDQSYIINPSINPVQNKESAQRTSSGTEHGIKFFHNNGVRNFTIH